MVFLGALVLTIIVGIYLTYTESDTKLEKANMGFELAGKDGLPFNWRISTVGYSVLRDSTTHTAGHYSLLLASKDNTIATTPHCKVNEVFNLDAKEGMEVRLSASIRTENLDSGDVSLWIHFIDRDSIVLAKSLDDPNLKGTTSWKRYSFEFKIPKGIEGSEHSHIAYGFTVSGRGKTWFDDINLEINGEPFTNFIWHKVFG